MNREARRFCVLLTAAMFVGVAGCAHKPAYSEMDGNRAATNQNQKQPGEGQSTAATPSATEPPSKEAASSTPAPTQPAQFKNPSFLDQTTGGVRDLPSYPRAYRVSAQIGPMQGMDTMSLALQTNEPMDKITAFYEQVIKANKWTVTDKVIDPEFSEWNLKKGDAHAGKVQVKKDPKTSVMNIIIVRTEKLEATSK